MIRRRKFLVLLLSCCAPLGCIRSASKENARDSDERVTFETDDRRMAISFPAGWQRNEGKHPYSLHCFAPEQTMYSGVYVYAREELSGRETPNDVFWWQVEDFKSKRANGEIFGNLREYKHGGKMISTIAVRGDKDGEKFYYTFSLIEFHHDKSCFAVMLQSMRSERFALDRKRADEIAESAKLLPAAG
jgi:hypothetical protein